MFKGGGVAGGAWSGGIADWALRTIAVAVSIPRVILFLLSITLSAGREASDGEDGTEWLPASFTDELAENPFPTESCESVVCDGEPIVGGGGFDGGIEGLNCDWLFPPPEVDATGLGGLTWPPPLLSADAKAAPPLPALGRGGVPPTGEPLTPPPPRPPVPPDPLPVPAPPALVPIA